MKVAYFDCSAGVSGDMLIGSLIDAGLDFDALRDSLSRLPLPGYELAVNKVKKNGVSGTRFLVSTPKNADPRSLSQILTIIASSSLKDSIKEAAGAVFKKIGTVEAKIHNKNIEDIHFHEIGAVDSIIDIVGSAIAFDILSLDRIQASPVNLGEGFVNTGHGLLPVPAPATAALLLNVPVYSNGIQAELATPTGAALISYFAKHFGSMPDMRVHSIGYGAGAKDLQIPNLLRVYIGDAEINIGYEKIFSLETNIDDMNPEFYGYISETLFLSGALDVYTTPVIMKKSRPGVKLTVLSMEENRDRLMDLIFKETTTAGVRISSMERKVLERSVRQVETQYGAIGVKILISEGSIITVSPEYEDCRAIAQKQGVPLKRVYEAAKKEALSLINK
jgi:pyridinium-3,5-bisthiocarboxylic acid mononucleotide nickel chelatase